VNGQALCSECHLIKSLSERGFSSDGVVKKYGGIDLASLARECGGVVDDSVFTVGNSTISMVDNRIRSDRNLITAIRLAHPGCVVFFRDEVLCKRDIVRSMINHRAGNSGVRVGARSLSVVELDSNSAREFFTQNHLAGSTRALLAYGLSDGERILSAISFRKPFVQSDGCIEIARAASAAGTSVAGGFSKLLAHAKGTLISSGYSKIMTYSDLRYGDGSSYLAAGFARVADTKQDYYYTNGFVRFNRFKFRARDGKSERDVANDSGVYKLWGLGHARYEVGLG
jgi:hypothetical protein